MKLARISQISKLQDLLRYKSWKHDQPVVAVPQDIDGKPGVKFYVNGKFYGEIRKITPAIAEREWYQLYKVDHIYVVEQEFQEYAKHTNWHGMSEATRKSVFKSLYHKHTGKHAWLVA